MKTVRELRKWRKVINKIKKNKRQRAMLRSDWTYFDVMTRKKLL